MSSYKLLAALVITCLPACVLSSAYADEWTGSKEVVCKKATGHISINGKLDEPAWGNAVPISFALPVSFKAPESKTTARLLWDEKFIYVGFEAMDKDVWSYFTKRDSPTCQEDVLEFFFKTDPVGDPYYNFEINARGTVYDAFALKLRAGGTGNHRWNTWNCKGARVGVTVDGTINNPGDIDSGWCLELAIPFAELPTLNGRIPTSGDKWKCHLARYDYSIYLTRGLELTSCAPLMAVDFHGSEDWLPLQFAE